jgi:hypothetical protein
MVLAALLSVQVLLLGVAFGFAVVYPSIGTTMTACGCAVLTAVTHAAVRRAQQSTRDTDKG